MTVQKDIERGVPPIDCITDDAELAALENAFGNLACIVGLQREAVKYRLDGMIATAMSCERAMERHYAELPEWAKW